MRRLIAVLLIGASAAWGLTSINAYKTFTREIVQVSLGKNNCRIAIKFRMDTELC